MSLAGVSVVPTPSFVVTAALGTSIVVALTAPLKFVVPDTIKFDMVVIQRLYLSVPVPTTPNKSLFTNSYQFIA